MTPSELLIECRKLDIRFTVDRDGGLKVNAPDGVLVPELLAKLKEHKRELIKLLSVSVCTTPKSTEKNGGSADSDAKFWEEARKVFDPRARFVAANGDTPARPEGACPKCGSTGTTDTERHEGRSIRRDCDRCEHFIAWVKWHGTGHFPIDERN